MSEVLLCFPNEFLLSAAFEGMDLAHPRRTRTSLVIIKTQALAV